MNTPQIAHRFDSLASIVPGRIVLATDLSDITYLLPHAIAQCKACAASLFIVHVIPPANSASIEDAVYLVADMSRTRTGKQLHHARSVLDAAARQVRAAGIYCETMIRHGHAREEIADVTYRVHAGRLILGTHARGNVGKFFLGSTALESLETAKIPVWTIGPLARPTPHGKPSRILHPVSLSSAYKKSAHLATQLAQFYKAEITLLHVLPRTSLSDYPGTHLVDWTARELKLLIPAEMSLWTTAQVRVETGNVVEQILAVAKELQVDLIVMGAKPCEERWFGCSNKSAYSVIAQATCPVATFRHAHAHEAGVSG
jgi:nucleotide-binding universal stress UspA family protein